MPNTEKKVILVAGTPGTDTDQAVRRIVDYADAHTQPGKWVRTEKFEKLLLDVHNEKNPGERLDDLTRLLEQPKAALRSLWRLAGERLCERLRAVEPKAEVILVPIHLVWMNHHIRDFIHVIDAKLIPAFSNVGIRHVLCLIDDINDVYKRLTGPNRLYDPRWFPLSGQEQQEGFVLRRFLELLEWRRREIAEGEALADHLDSSFTLLATKHQRCAAFRCLVGEPQAYLSHPITELRRLERSQREDNKALNEEVRKWLWEFQRVLSEHIALIQPTCIDEYRHVEGEQGMGLGSRFYSPRLYADCLVPPAVTEDREILVPAGDGASQMAARTVSQIVEVQVNYQVTSRDLQLVAQAPYLVLFRPRFNGDLPGGVWQEIAEFEKIGPYSRYRDRRIFVLESELDKSRVPPRQFLEKLIRASEKGHWSGQLSRDKVCDYLAQLSPKTCNQITEAATSGKADLAGNALERLLSDLGMSTEWRLQAEDSGHRRPLNDAGIWPRRIVKGGEFLTSLLDTGAASERALPNGLTTRIPCDGRAPADLAEELLSQMRVVPAQPDGDRLKGMFI